MNIIPKSLTFNESIKKGKKKITALRQKHAEHAGVGLGFITFQ